MTRPPARLLLVTALIALALLAPVVAFSVFVRATIDSELAMRNERDRQGVAQLAADLVREQHVATDAQLQLLMGTPRFIDALRRRDEVTLREDLARVRGAGGHRYAFVADAAGVGLAYDPVRPGFSPNLVSFADSGIFTAAVALPTYTLSRFIGRGIEVLAPGVGEPGPQFAFPGLSRAVRGADGTTLGVLIIGLEPARMGDALRPLGSLPGREILVLGRGGNVLWSSRDDRDPAVPVPREAFPLPLAFPGALQLATPFPGALQLATPALAPGDARLPADPGQSGMLTMVFEGAVRSVAYAPISPLGLSLFIIDDPAVVLAAERRLAGQIELAATIAAIAAVMLATAFAFLVGRLDRQRAALQLGQTQLTRLNEELLAANRTKSEFLASMSHELRTPLNAIIGFSDVLLDRTMPVDEQTKASFLGNILDSGRHLLGLINDILDLSKVEAGKMELHPEEFDLAEALGGVHAVIRPLAEKKRLGLALEIDPTLGTVQHDPARFKQLLYNLLSNAVKFTPEGGQVTIRAAVSGALFTVAVSDTGIGIRPADLPLLFEEFRQLDAGYVRQQQGTGLGLALVRRFARLMGGEVNVESAPGQGSTFTVTLPLRQEESAAPATAAASGPLVLVVEDDARAAALLSLHLSRAGYRVERAGSGAEALAKARTLRPAAITLDILLPHEDGWALLREFKGSAATAGIPVVVVSVVDDPGTARETGAAAHLLKPVDPTALVATIRGLVNG